MLEWESRSCSLGLCCWDTVSLFAACRIMLFWSRKVLFHISIIGHSCLTMTRCLALLKLVLFRRQPQSGSLCKARMYLALYDLMDSPPPFPCCTELALISLWHQYPPSSTDKYSTLLGEGEAMKFKIGKILDQERAC